MRIAMVSEHASPLAAIGGVDAGGQNVHVASLAAALAARGHTVTVYTRRDDPDLPRRVEMHKGVDVVHVDAGPARAVSKDELLPWMDDFEASRLVGFPVGGVESGERAARILLRSGPSLVALAVPGVGDLVASRKGTKVLPLRGSPVVDRTGAGDAFFAGLVMGVACGWSPAEAGNLAARAAGETVRRLGGRPDLVAIGRRMRPLAPAG